KEIKQLDWGDWEGMVDCRRGWRQAAVFEGEGRRVVRDVEPPELRAPDDVLLAVRAAGICGTDVHILAVPPGHPATPGVIMRHEYAADVVATGDRVDHVAPGDRIVVDPSIWCGSCPYCQMGLTNLCDRMTGVGIFRHGGFAPLSVVPARAVYRISSDVASEIAALAGPLAGVLNGIRKLGVIPARSALVLRAGPAGGEAVRRDEARTADPWHVHCPGDVSPGGAAPRGRPARLWPAGDPPRSAA